ncbi:MAG: trp operon repressor [Patescibacteria group bacterium]|nr:trp operon repressor [Patescibacteria group bacterium]
MTRLIQSRRKLPLPLEKEAVGILFREVSRVRSERDLISFFDKYLNESEKEIIVRRVIVGILLERKMSYRKIRNLLEISQSTISNVRDILENRGYGRNPKRRRIYSYNRKPRKRRPLLGCYKGAPSII